MVEKQTVKAPVAPRKNPLKVLATLAVVTGMLGVVGLPAYAASTAEEAVTTAPVSEAKTQSIAVSANLAAAVPARDAFGATTPEELAQQRAEAARLASAALYASYASYSSGPRAAGDDYPWRGGGGLSPLSYYVGECVDFVAWRLNRDAGYTSAPFRWTWSSLTPGGGSAVSWRSAWEAQGWPVSSTPVVGAVALTQYDHVAYVREVLGNGSVVIEEYNYGNYHAYGQRTIAASSVLAFLYPPG